MFYQNIQCEYNGLAYIMNSCDDGTAQLVDQDGSIINVDYSLVTIKDLDIINKVKNLRNLPVPTTTVAPTTTLVPTTTVAPTTTSVPTTTLPPLLGLFTTESQGTITPAIALNPTNGTEVSWDWGDGNQTLDNNNPSHTYIDGLPSHDVDIFGIDPLTVDSIQVDYDKVTEVYLTSFDNLTYLDLLANNLTSLDVSNNTQLTTLICGNNNLTSLDVSNNTQLTILGAYANNLTSLDVSNNTLLTELTLGNNNLSALDISNNTQLVTLGVFINNLTSLDVSNNTLLTTLRCNRNNLSTLDISNNTLLTDLRCNLNNLNSTQIDQILIDLDSFGLSNGILRYQGNPGESNLTALTAYNKLIGKGWTITGNVPA